MIGRVDEPINERKYRCTEGFLGANTAQKCTLLDLMLSRKSMDMCVRGGRQSYFNAIRGVTAILLMVAFLFLP